MEPFLQEPTKEHYLMGISRRTGIAHTSIKRNLDLLEEEGLISKREEQRGSRTFPLYRASKNDEEFRQQKMTYNLTSIKESGIISYLEDVVAPKAIVLFGSYAQGEDVEDSDIDLFIESEEENVELSFFEQKLKRKVQLHCKQPFSKYPKELKNNIINGVTLSGFLEAFP